MCTFSLCCSLLVAQLAEANRMGEMGRKEEVMRIFGLDI